MLKTKLGMVLVKHVELSGKGTPAKDGFLLKKKKISSSLTLKTPNKNVPEVCFRVLNCTCKTKAFFNSGKHFAWKILICALPIMPFLISPDFPTFLTRQKAAALPVPGDLLPRANVNSGTDMFSTLKKKFKKRNFKALFDLGGCTWGKEWDCTGFKWEIIHLF